MDELILELSNIGFNEYEAKAYSVLLQHKLLSASEIYKKAEIPRGRIYDILLQLTQKGFCNILPGAINKYMAVEPTIAINNLIEAKHEEAKILEKKMLETANKLQTVFEKQEDTSSPLDYIQVLMSKPSMIKKFHELGNKAKKIVRSFNKAPYAVTLEIESIKKDSAPILESLRKGTIGKALYEIDEDNLSTFIESLKYYRDLGEEIKVCKHLPMKMLISDNNTVMISLRNNGSTKFNLTSMIVEHSDLTDALIELFDIYWEKALSLEEFIRLTNSKKQENL